MQIAMAFWASKTLMSAVELGIFDTLASGPWMRPHSGCAWASMNAVPATLSTRWWPKIGCNETMPVSTPTVPRRESKGGLVGLDRRMAGDRRPPGQDHAGQVLQREGSAQVQDVECRIGPPGHLLGEILRQTG